MFQNLKRLFSPEEIETRRIQQLQGVGAETILRAVGPIVEKRLEEVIQQLVQAKPDLPILLDLRAQLSEIYRIQKELKAMSSLGKEAGEALAEIFQPI